MGGSLTRPRRGGPLRRNLRRRRIGGVCAGIADALGVDALWVRLAAVASLFVSFSLTFWGYLALWVLVPARPETPMPEVGGALRRDLRRVDRLVRRVHRQLPAAVADRVERTFDALKMLAGEVQSLQGADPAMREAWERAGTRLPALLQRMLGAGAETGRMASEAQVQAAFGAYLEELEALERSLRATGREALGEELARSARPVSAEDGRPQELVEWRRRMGPLRATLQERTRPQIPATLGRIEEKLAFLFTRSEEDGGPFDLRPFELRKIAFEYIPEAVEKYLELPPDMARSQPIAQGITAEDALNDQLIRLDHALEEMAASLFERDAQGLLIHGRFLRSKFAEQPFGVGARGAAPAGQAPERGAPD